MGSLGFFGSVYMFFLLALLVVALGAGVNYIAHAALSVLGKGTSSQTHYTTIVKGGYKIMENNQWLRYALYSFLGILLLMAVGGLMTGNQQAMYGHQGMMTGNMGGGMQMQSGGMPQVILVPVAVMPMGQMGMQGGMGAMPMGMQGGMMGMPMGQNGNMGQMQGGSGMGMMMPMGMQGGGMGMMNMGGQGGSMGNMQQSGGMSGGSSGGMGGMM